MNIKTRSILILVIAQVSALSLWFISSAVLPDMLRDFPISAGRQAALNSAVPAGFVVGALASALLGLSDRFDLLVGALTFGSASPHLVAWMGEADWQTTIKIVSSFTLLSALLILFSSLGPHHAKSPAFKMSSITQAWTNKRVRYAYLGYFGHMWELYAMWAWIGVACYASYSLSMSESDAISFSKITAFLAIGLGGIACFLGGYWADIIGKARITIIAMAFSFTGAILTALTFGGPPWITFVAVVIWGIAIIPDSPQFSALVADGSPPEIAGSLMTFQTAIGFALTIFTVQITPYVVQWTSWPTVMIIMAIGPLFGIYFMRKLEQLDEIGN